MSEQQTPPVTGVEPAVLGPYNDATVYRFPLAPAELRHIAILAPKRRGAPYQVQGALPDHWPLRAADPLREIPAQFNTEVSAAWQPAPAELLTLQSTLTAVQAHLEAGHALGGRLADTQGYYAESPAQLDYFARKLGFELTDATRAELPASRNGVFRETDHDNRWLATSESPPNWLLAAKGDALVIAQVREATYVYRSGEEAHHYGYDMAVVDRSGRLVERSAYADDWQYAFGRGNADTVFRETLAGAAIKLAGQRDEPAATLGAEALPRVARDPAEPVRVVAVGKTPEGDLLLQFPHGDPDSINAVRDATNGKLVHTPAGMQPAWLAVRIDAADKALRSGVIAVRSTSGIDLGNAVRAEASRGAITASAQAPAPQHAMDSYER